MKYEVEQSSIYSLSLIVFHYYLEGDVDVAHYTISNASFNAEIKMLQFHFILYEDTLFKPRAFDDMKELDELLLE